MENQLSYSSWISRLYHSAALPLAFGIEQWISFHSFDRPC